MKRDTFNSQEELEYLKEFVRLHEESEEKDSFTLRIDDENKTSFNADFSLFLDDVKKVLKSWIMSL